MQKTTQKMCQEELVGRHALRLCDGVIVFVDDNDYSLERPVMQRLQCAK